MRKCGDGSCRGRLQDQLVWQEVFPGIFETVSSVKTRQSMII